MSGSLLLRLTPNSSVLSLMLLPFSRRRPRPRATRPPSSTASGSVERGCGPPVAWPPSPRLPVVRRRGWRGARRPNGEPDCEPLERLAHLVRLEKVLGGKRVHDGAPPGAHGDEPLGGETSESFPDRPAADAEALRECQLLQLGAGRKAVREDLLTQMGVRALGERQVLQLWNSVVLFALNRRLGGHCILPAKAVGSPRAPIVDSYQPTLTPVERGDQGARRSPSRAR